MTGNPAHERQDAWRAGYAAALDEVESVVLRHEERHRGRFAEVAHRIWRDLRDLRRLRIPEVKP
jgi:hypothetical protein